ncbi:hypothetical protein Q5752_003137 [Cryptotrichosporon argae]
MPFSLPSPDRLRSSPKSGGFKSSLRKLPSSLFAHDKRATMTTHLNKNTNTMSTITNRTHTNMHATRTLATVDEAGTSGKQDKKKPTKTRRALADILGWGISNAATATSSPAPPPPPKDAPRRLAGSSGRPTTKQPAATLRAPSAGADIVRRPSCGDDPFVRFAQGATVVDHVHKPTVKPASVKGIEAERRSLGSVKATSTKTVDDNASSKGSRSKVWGIFTGSKSKRVSPKGIEEMRPAPATIRGDTADMYQVVEGMYAPPPVRPPSTMHRIPRPRPPVLHLTKASVDTAGQSVKSPSETVKLDETVNSVESAESVASVQAQSVPQVDLDSPFVVASSAPISTGMWESVVGTAGERPSEDGPRVVAALAGLTRLPKRKSLSGIFSLAVKRSLEKIRSSPPRKDAKARGESGERRRPPPLTLRSLAEEIEGTEQDHSGPSPAPYISRFGATQSDKSAEPKKTDFATVTSATSQLFDLLTTCNFSATSSPASVYRRSLAMTSSMQSLRGAAQSIESPTPVRKSRSAFALGKGAQRRSSPVKRASPLKNVLHRGTDAAASPSPKAATQESPVSMVKKGMRNIFAPPSPLARKTGNISPPREFRQLASGLASPVKIQSLSSLPSVHEHDIPSDLRAELSQITQQPSPATTRHLELPSAMHNRPSVTGRRNRMAQGPEDIALVAHMKLGRVSPVAPHISLDLGRPLSPDDASFSALLSPPPMPIAEDDMRKSFDFTEEYAKLDQGDQRASFVEALVAMRQPSATLQRLTAALSDEQLRSPTDTFFSQDITQTVHERTQTRAAPFRGDFAFQQTFSQQTRAAITPPSIALPPVPAPTLGPPAAPAPAHRRGHRRDGSGMSFASMSSLGAPIESGIAGEYTNYFEKEFASAIPDNALVRQPSQESVASVNSQTAARRHHRRSSSICSVDSVAGAEIAYVMSGPPISMHNATRRSSYVSRHRRDGSADSMISAIRGRPDWAAHRRNASSADSTSSFTRLGRPGLGERMFQLDGGVQLTSITGSPPDEQADSAATAAAAADALDSPLLPYQPDTSSTLYEHSNRHLSWTSTLDSGVPLTDDEGSLFGADHSRSAPPSSFFLRARPVSAISSVSSSENADDTFINVVKYAQRAVGMEQYISGIGENILSTPASTFQQPRSAPHRRRPADLVLPSDLDTPGLTSPSSSETSSRMSIDTRFSDSLSGIVVADGRARPVGAGHTRGKSSTTAGVKVDATIHEDVTMATVRQKATPHLEDEAVYDALLAKTSHVWESNRPERIATANTWRNWQREADDEFRRTREVWADSAESKQAVADFKMPLSQAEIAAFLALSSQAYKPLDQVARTAMHRRKSSLADARTKALPYAPPVQTKTKPMRKSDPPRGNPFESFFGDVGLNASGLPLPRECRHPYQTKRGSLITKFERTNSAASTATIGSDEVAPPSAGVFAHFVTGFAPATPPKMATGLKPLMLATTPGCGKPEPAPQSPLDQPREDRAARRVASAVRRKNLGWGRRRNSDGPNKIIGNETAATPGAAKSKSSLGVPGPLDLGESGTLRHRETPADVPMPVYDDDRLRPSPVPFQSPAEAQIAIEVPPSPTKPAKLPVVQPIPLATLHANVEPAHAPQAKKTTQAPVAQPAPFADADGDVSPPRPRVKSKPRTFAVYDDASDGPVNGPVFDRPVLMLDKENIPGRTMARPPAPRHASSRKTGSSRASAPTRPALRA